MKSTKWNILGMILIKLFLIFNLITYRVILQTFPEMIWKNLWIGVILIKKKHFQPLENIFNPLKIHSQGNTS